VDTLGHLLAQHVTPADANARAQVGQLAKAVQAATGESVEFALADPGYTGEKLAAEAREHGIKLESVLNGLGGRLEQPIRASSIGASIRKEARKNYYFFLQ
jgi:hypothetical protein